MKGKAKQKRKIGKAILIGMGFFLTIVLTFTTTLAWFYDSDWASKYINMAGTVGIEIRRELQDGEPAGTNLRTSGTGNLYFHLFDEENNPKAYPGQAINVSASVFNNGGKSTQEGKVGSPCYIRAHFAVYTNIGKLPIKTDYLGGADNAIYKALRAQVLTRAGLTEESDEEAITAALAAANLKVEDYTSIASADPVAYTEAYQEALKESDMNATALYAFLDNLITKQNALNSGATPTGYSWVYYQHTGALPLSASGTETDDVDYYLEGTKYKDESKGLTSVGATEVDNVAAVVDKGYFYLCESEAATAGNSILKELNVNTSAVFLWNNKFIIPWQLTNNSADKIIFVGLTFQAIQTYIPIMEADGTINGNANNKLDADECTISSTSVQTVFNSCKFDEIETTVTIGGQEIDFSNSSLYDTASTSSRNND